MDVSDADAMLAKEIEDDLMKYTQNDIHKVEVDLVTKTDAVQTNSDVDVNITECTPSLRNELVAAESQDTTETSSSFDDCNSDIENIDNRGDSEALSGFNGDAASALEFDRFFQQFGRTRSKKLTTHWRSFIRPLMYRCKWVELQMKKLQSQAQLYDKKLEAYNNKYWTQLDNSTMTDGTRSLPFLKKNNKIDVFKRKKRRRTEATMDVKAHMSHHNLFTFFENKKCTEGAFPSNGLNNPVNQKFATDQEDILGNYERLSGELEDGDDNLEQILLTIDFLQSEVCLLKKRFYSIRDIGESISFGENLDLTPPHSENRMEGACIASQSRDVLVPETGAISYLDAPGTNGPPCITAYTNCIHVEEGDLIDYQRVKEEINSYDQMKIQQIPSVLNYGSANTSTIAPFKEEPYLLPDDGAPVKVRSIENITTSAGSKRKRGKKKAASGGRGRR